MKALAGCLPRTEPVRLQAHGDGLWVDPRAAPLKRARAEVLKQLRAARMGSVVPVDLEGVMLTASCHAQLFGPVLQRVVEGQVPGRFVIASDAEGQNEWDADAALRTLSERLGKKFVCVWETERGARLVGSVDEQVQLTYDFLCRMWLDSGEGSTARELARHSKSSIQAASNRLAKIATLGLAYATNREPVPGGGVQFRYVPVM